MQKEAKRTVCDTETLGGCVVKGILSEGWERMHLEEYAISRGVRVRDILFANLLDTPDAKEFLVSRCESQHEIHIYAKRVARLGLVPSASYLYIAADSVISCTAIPLKVDGRFDFRRE